MEQGLQEKTFVVDTAVRRTKNTALAVGLVVDAAELSRDESQMRYAMGCRAIHSVRDVSIN